ncbi:MAG: heparan-alpha-glucosaminide N-acetyltransferase domain-containing protein [Promethearchaeota archaeon]
MSEVSEPKNVKKQRFEVIDTLRGLSLTYMMIIHCTQLALIIEYKWFWALLYTFIDTIGVPAFLLCSGFAISISVNKKFEKGKKQGLPDEVINKLARNDTFFRGAFIFAIGIVYNIGFAYFNGGFIYIWSWTILQLMGISQILTFYFRKLKLPLQIIIIATLVFISKPLFDNLYLNPDPKLGILGFILFSPGDMNPPIPFLSYSFLGGILGDLLMSHPHPHLMVKSKAAKFNGSLLIYGSILMVIGILMGLQPIGAHPFPDNFNGQYQNLCNALGVSYLPTFLNRSTIPNIIYNMGFLLIIIFLLNLYYINRGMNKKNYLQIFSVLGKGSLTIYLGHHVLAFVIFRRFTVYTVWFLIVPLLIPLIYFFYWWYKKNNYKYGIEWGIEKLRSKFFNNYFTKEELIKKYNARMTKNEEE